MADLLFGDFMRTAKTQAVQRTRDLANFSDNELRARYRFGRQAI